MLVLCFGLDFKSQPRDFNGGGRGFYCTTEASSLIKEVHSPSGMYYLVGTSVGTTHSKSTMAGCVKPLYLGCVFELLRAFEISQICWGVG